MIDGPYTYERDIIGGLRGGKGTFFLNVSASLLLHLSVVFKEGADGQGQNYDCIYNHVDDIRYLDSQYVLLALYLHLMPFSSSTNPYSRRNRKRLIIRGHTIASHTWSHTDMTTLSYEQLHNELARVEQALIRILGKKPLYVCHLPTHLHFHTTHPHDGMITEISKSLVPL